MLNNYEIYINLIVLGVAHAIVDAACIALTITCGHYQHFHYNGIITVVVIYNIIAFGLQPLIGELIDNYNVPRQATILGCLLTALASIMNGFSLYIVIFLAGIGNAIFHAGAGSICLNLHPGKATPPGIFVAPGALGVYWGTISGSYRQFIGFNYFILLLILGSIISIIKIPIINYKKAFTIYDKKIFFDSILLILFTISIRSMTPYCVSFPWKSNSLLFILTLAIVFGKGIGGILADKFGRRNVAVASLIISAPLISFASDFQLAGILGMFLFNFTMPITLVAVSDALRGKPAFAFGLTCLALVVGAFPTYFDFSNIIKTPVFVFIIVLISALSIFQGLKKLEKIKSITV